MKGIELTPLSTGANAVWVETSNIVSVKSYVGFDGRVIGSQGDLTNKTHLHVEEDYVTIVEALETETLDGAGNVLWSGVPDDAPTVNIPTRIFASKTGKKISNADKMCDF